MREELSTFYEFKMPFDLAVENLKEITNDRFPDDLLEKAKLGLISAF